MSNLSSQQNPHPNPLPKYRARGFALLGCLLLVAGCASHAQKDLAGEFQSPPDSAKPRTWWHWVSGNVSKEGITADLEAMKRVGVGGAQMFSVDQGPKGPVVFMSPEWRDLVKYAIAESDRLGIELTMHDCEGWSESGGPWITPEMSMQKIVWSESQVHGPAKIDAALREPEKVKDYYRDIVVYAFPTITGPAAQIPDIKAKSGMQSKVLPDDPPSTQPSPQSILHRDKLIDLTSRLAPDGRLTWEIPAGDWTILRIGHTSTGKANAPAMPGTRGLECDKMNPDAVRAHFAGMMGKVIDDSKPLIGKGLKFVLMDSWEAGCQNWTPKFREEFQKRRGYDPLPWLCAVTGRYVDDPESTERFLWDFRRTIADLIAENHYALIQQLCHEHKLQLTAEAVGIGMPTIADELQCKGRTDIPMGEFWIERRSEAGDPKEAASAAHIYGKQFAAAEAFTATPQVAKWTNDPYSLKALGDRQFCAGINRFVFHRYAHQPWLDRRPGMTMGPWGINFERTNTWWEPGAAWITYLSRCQYLLQQGLFVADICYYYGEGAPRDFQYANLKPPPPPGYDFDVCNTEVLLTRMKVRDGRIVLPDGMSYRVLVLPDTTRMTPAVARKIEQLARDGATILGPIPTGSPSLSGYPECDAEVKEIADRSWMRGKGPPKPVKPIRELYAFLETVGPDFVIGDPNIGLRYIHRRAGDADIYFVSNQENRAIQTDCAFRVTGKRPELWHPDTGKIENAAAYSIHEGRTVVPLRFDPAGSVFVVFRKSNPGDNPITSVTRAGQDLLAPSTRPTVSKLEIRKAVYGALDGGEPSQIIDVTERVAKFIDGNWLSIPATNELAGKDPARNIPKKLRVEYVVDGRSETVTVDEGETLELPNFEFASAPAMELAANRDGSSSLIAWEPGSYQVGFQKRQARTIQVQTLPPAVEIGGPWQLRIPDQPSPLTLEKLISWTEHPDDAVKYFSGTATYRKDFDVSAELIGPDRRLCLDLGKVKNLAEVKLNGTSLGVLWKPPFSVDVSSLLRAGPNYLEVSVTNLWPNRLIGDLNLPENKRTAWTTYNPYKKDSTLLESGLLGPVTIRAGQIVPLKP